MPLTGSVQVAGFENGGKTHSISTTATDTPRRKRPQVSGNIGGRSRIRTYDFHRVKVALYR